MIKHVDDVMVQRSVYFYGGNHPIHEAFIKYPPDGFIVKSNLSVDSFNQQSTYDFLPSARRRISNIFINTLGIPRMIVFPFISNINMIHTGNGIIPLTRLPWVVSVEYFSSFFGLNYQKALKPRAVRLLKRFLSSLNCKRILCLSEAGRKSIINAYKSSKDNFVEKMEVLYPAIPPPQVKRINREDDKIRILFIGAGFFEKGGQELLKALDIVRKKTSREIELVAVVNTQMSRYRKHFLSLIEKYRKDKRNKFIIHWVPRQELFKSYYSMSDIFVLPSFGGLMYAYAFLDAMSMGLPIIAQDVFTTSEVVEDGKNGLLVKNPDWPFPPNYLRTSLEDETRYISLITNGEFLELERRLAEKILILVEDDKLRKKLGDKGLEMVMEGRFSIKVRNERLKRIYEGAISG